MPTLRHKKDTLMTEYKAKRVILKDALGNYLIPYVDNKVVSGFNILDCKWSDHIINDISWLRADTFNWQDGNDYPETYNELLSEIKEWQKTHTEADYEIEDGVTFLRTQKGYKIVFAGEQETQVANKYERTGIAWFYILDIENKKFKLPRTKFGFEGIRTSSGNDISAGLPDPNIDLLYRQDSTSSGVYTNKFGSDGYTGSSYSNTSGTDEYMQSSLNLGKVAPLGAICTNSLYGNNSTVQPPATEMYLYFYVGNYTKTVIEQAAGINSESLNNKVDISSLSPIIPVIDFFVSGKSGYIIHSNGYCRQWGTIPFGATGGWASGNITFLKKFKNVDYSLLGRGNWSDAASSDFRVNSMSTTGFNVTVAINTLTAHNGQWEATGLLADGEY